MTDRFTLLDKIGRGGMAVVWRARDEETGQIVALKILHAAYAEDAEYETRFERELELAQRIKSPNVVGVLGYGVREGAPYLALEYVEGQTLRQQLAAHGPYNWEESRALLLQISNGLAAAHAAGVIHRDIKPSNILMTTDGTAKIADFGIARGIDLTRVTATSTMLGTPTYLPPEGPKDSRSDLYSLGILAYELMAGVPPFEGSTHAEVLMAHVRAAPDLQRIPVEARPIVGWLLEKDPKKRPQSAVELIAALEGKRAATTLAAPAPERINAAGAALAAGVPARSTPGAMPVSPPPGPPVAPQYAPQPRFGAPAGPPTPPQYAQRPPAPHHAPPPPEPGNSNGPLYLLLAFGLVAVLAMIGAVVVLTANQGGAAQTYVTVPNVTNLSVSDATGQIRDEGLVVGTSTYQADPIIGIGQVISSDPRAGLAVARNTVVNLVISSGPAPSVFATPSRSPSPSPTPSPTQSPTPEPTPSPTPEPTPSPTESPTPPPTPPVTPSPTPPAAAGASA